MYTRTKLKRYT